MTTQTYTHKHTEKAVLAIFFPSHIQIVEMCYSAVQSSKKSIIDSFFVNNLPKVFESSSIANGEIAEHSNPVELTCCTYVIIQTRQSVDESFSKPLIILWNRHEENKEKENNLKIIE